MLVGIICIDIAIISSRYSQLNHCSVYTCTTEHLELSFNAAVYIWHKLAFIHFSSEVFGSSSLGWHLSAWSVRAWGFLLTGPNVSCWLSTYDTFYTWQANPARHYSYFSHTCTCRWKYPATINHVWREWKLDHWPAVWWWSVLSQWATGQTPRTLWSSPQTTQTWHTQTSYTSIIANE